MRANRTLHELAAAFLGALLLFVVGSAHAQTIVNTASAQWRSGDTDLTTDSNEVSLDVTDPGVTIQTFRNLPGGGEAVTFQPSLCGGNPVALPRIGSGAAPATLDLAPTSVVRAGEPLVYRIEARLANRDSAVIDTIETVLTTPSGDEETVTVYETGENTGVFVGILPTSLIPPSPVPGDCVLAVRDGENIQVVYRSAGGRTIIETRVEVIAEPSGFVFDSQTGTPVSGATVTLIDITTGQPAKVFGPDGTTPWPSTVVSGEPVTDAAGNTFQLEPGEYWFPVVLPGRYRIEVAPPAPFIAPSEATPAELAGFSRPTGGSYNILDASYGETFSLGAATSLRADIPLDRPETTVSLVKTASRAIAAPGDALFYTVTVTNTDPFGPKRNVTLVDTPPASLRLRKDAIFIDGEPAGPRADISPDGRRLTITFDQIAAGASHVVRYAMSVRETADPGEAVNRATATDGRGNSVTTDASVRIDRDVIADRMTLIGRVTEGSCMLEDSRRGIPGVRVMLEDGSFAITDIDGRYHFEGLMPGTHVVQAHRQTLPEGGEFVDCSRSTANAGSASSRFVRGQGGSLAVADFHADLPEGWAPPVEDTAALPLEDSVAAGGETDWSAVGAGPTEFLFPEIGHNPRAPAIRVAIRHGLGERVELTSNGRAVDPLSFDGVKRAADGTYAVSVWRGVALDGEMTMLQARVLGENGATVTELERRVDFAAAPARAELLEDRSRLVADGAEPPVIAVRITDRKGRPVRAGVSGTVTLNAPYESAQAIALQQSRQLTSIGPAAAPAWTVEGDDGIALIELAPTLVSGPLRMDFLFTDGRISREQEIESWIVPGDQEWTLVGLAEGAVGARSIADNMERSGNFDSDLGEDARVAFYAKGKVLGRFLVTAAYDSAKQRNEERLQGVIDPNAYYTVFADGSVRRFDAASREKLYVRIETRAFYAIYGDFVTGFDQTELARYNRAATGVKAEGRFGAVHVQGFAAETETRFRRDEIQGNGLTGPYRLSSRAIVANSERVAIEVRDRFRSELVVERRELERFVDYDIDLLSGTITFKQPVLSRDFALNPQFIIVEYEIDELRGSGEWNAGVRGDVTLADGAVRLGATAITDKGDGPRTEIVGTDARVRIGAATEIRAELAASRTAGDTSTAWQVEAEHRDGKVDVLAYAKEIEAEFGTGQQSVAERGRRKFGFDGRYSPTERLSIIASAWRDQSLTDAARRDAVQLQGAWRNQATDVRLGLAHFSDRFADGNTGDSTVFEAGASQRLLGNRLEVNASSSIALSGTDSIDLPTRHRFGASYALTNDIRAIGVYEIAEGDAIDARTIKGGVEVSPWAGARVSTTLGQQDIDEYGKRSFAAFGLAQSLAVTEHLTLDATVDGNRQIGGVEIERVINPAQPVASGGQLGQDGELFEDFTAITLGAGWRKDRWSAVARGEWRDGEFADRTGATLGVIRQLGEGSVVGSGFTWTRAEGETGTMSEIFDATISAAHRPDESPFAFLAKLEYRSDEVEGAILGETGPAGRTALIVDGDALSRRLLGSLSTNWSPRGYDEDDGGLFQRTEIGVFVGARYNFDAFEQFDIEGFSVLGGLDARIGIGERFEIGGRASVRHSVTDDVTDFAIGPEIGFVPTDDVLLSVGYNVTGFRDRDFAAARFTERGLYANLRVKFDADSFSFLGLGR